MEANVFAVLPLDPAKLSLSRFSPSLQKCPSTTSRIKLCACMPTISKQCLTAPEGSESWKTWLWSMDEEKIGLKTQKFSWSEEVSRKAKLAALVLYRSLLLGAIGFGMAMPAVAGPSSVSQVVMKKVVEKTANKKIEKVAGECCQDNVPQGKALDEESSTADADHEMDSGAMSKSTLVLGENFWKDIKVSKGSIESILKNILGKDPANLDALECLATSLIEREDGANALTVIEKLEVLKPDDIEWKYLRGQAYDMIGEHLLAKDIFRRILKSEPFCSRAIQGLMMAMDELDQPEELMEIIEDTMLRARYEKNVTEGRNMGMLMGQYLMMKGHWEEALEHYQEMTEEDRKDFRPPLCQGLIYSAMGERAKAERHFKTYQKLVPKDYPERKLLDALMSRARQEGQRVYDQKQKDKYVWSWKKSPITSSDKSETG